MQAAGVYKGKLDGDPGPQTERALYAYFQPLVSSLRERAIGASSAGKLQKNGGRSVAFGSLLEADLPIVPLCINMKTSTKDDRSVFNDVCGEFETQNRRAVGFGGYLFAKPFGNWEQFAYAIEGREYKTVNMILKMTEYHNMSDPTRHTRVIARVLDEYFVINFEENKASFGFVGKRRRQSVPGNFQRPIRPN